MKAKIFKVVAFALWVASFSSAWAVDSPTQHKGWSFKEMAMIPIQSGGRMKPLDTFARELSVFETGSRSYQGWDPVELLASWLVYPTNWQDTAFLQVGREDVRRELNLDDKRTRFSPKELMTNSALGQYAQSMQVGDLSQPPQDQKKGPREDQRQQETKNVLERLGVFRNVVSGGAWLVIPTEAPAPWKSLAIEEGEAGAPAHQLSDGIKKKFLVMFQAYMNGDEPAFQKAAAEARAAVEGAVPGWNESVASKLRAEYLFNHTRPFLWAWIIYLVAALVWFFALGNNPRKGVRLAALTLTFGAWAVQSFGIGLRCYIAGRPPVTNMYESVVWVTFGVVLFASILYWIQKQGITLLVASALATFGLIAADAAPAVMDPAIHPLMPVLRSNYWLTIHVLTITLGYAAFALTFGLGNATLIQYLRSAPSTARSQKIATLNSLTYRATQFGTILLAAGTILGGVWADYSWGRFWGWDPKEVWALIALLCYLGILHARYAGWLAQFGFAVATVCAFLSVVMAWYGVNFVLGVGLHSYGFSTGGRGTVAAFVGAEFLFVAFVAIMHKREKSGKTSAQLSPSSV